jgi:hypothetical protein
LLPARAAALSATSQTVAVAPCSTPAPAKEKTKAPNAPLTHEQNLALLPVWGLLTQADPSVVWRTASLALATNHCSHGSGIRPAKLESGAGGTSQAGEGSAFMGRRSFCDQFLARHRRGGLGVLGEALLRLSLRGVSVPLRSLASSVDPVSPTIPSRRLGSVSPLALLFSRRQAVGLAVSGR